MRLFGYPYNDLVICKDSPDYLAEQYNFTKRVIKRVLMYSAVGRRTVSDIQHYKG